eukprot:73329-Pelagomonas_calceolata.AAC.1
MVCDKRLNLSTAAEAALKPYMAGTYRVKTLLTTTTCCCSRPQPYKLTACAHLALENICCPSRNVC